MTSEPQNRNTVQPDANKSEVFFLSRTIFRSIFDTQKGPLLPERSLSRRTSKSLPCQKSPSTKMASLYLVKTTSGVPGRPRRFFLYPTRCKSRKDLRKASSGFVSTERILDIVLLLCSVVFKTTDMRYSPLTKSTNGVKTVSTPINRKIRQFINNARNIIDHDKIKIINSTVMSLVHRMI